jgi:hypothetical protein
MRKSRSPLAVAIWLAALSCSVSTGGVTDPSLTVVSTFDLENWYASDIGAPAEESMVGAGS